MFDEPSVLLCHRCGVMITPGQGSFYIVRVEAFADPAPPALDPDETAAEIAADIHGIIDDLGGLSEQELLDQVHRRLTLHLCRRCYENWIEDPVR
jgi:hypothetical protein